MSPEIIHGNENKEKSRQDRRKSKKGKMLKGMLEFLQEGGRGGDIRVEEVIVCKRQKQNSKT